MSSHISLVWGKDSTITVQYSKLLNKELDFAYQAK